MLCFEDADRSKLEELLEKAEKNGVEGCQIISGDEVRQMEPQVSDQVVAALYAPAGGIVCPFGLTIALAENACANGAQFFLNQEVQNIVKKDGYYEVCTQDHVYETKLVVNAAGVYADVFHNMVSEQKIQIIPRKGEYCLLDKKVGEFVSHTIFQLPTKYGKGVLVTPTVHGNLMLGPTAVDELDKENIATTAEGLEDLQQRAGLSTPNLPKRQTITSFAGLRAHTEKNDFIKYLTKNKRVSFKYENESYHIEIDDVAVFPQCYAAVVDKIPTMAKKTLIVDIGSWTIDFMPVINKSPDESKCVTIPKGLITCMRSINEQCVRQLNGEVDESEIQNIMRYGRSDIDDEYFAIIKAEIEDFVDKVYNSIREFGYNLKTTMVWKALITVCL